MLDQLFMTEALRLAVKGQGRTLPNPMVGAVVVRDGKAIASGWHQCYGGAHAEVLALRKAGAKAKGAWLYVTLEPCFHQGRTPPCVEAVIKSGIRRVIVAMKDPNPLTCGKSIRKLRQAGVQVKVGVLAAEARRLNEVFVTNMTAHRPFIVAKSAQTLDGKIATRSSVKASSWITSLKTRRAARKKRSYFDAIMVGINTVLVDDPALTAADAHYPLKKIVVDSQLKISLKAKLFKDILPRQCIVATVNACSRKVAQLRRQGVAVLICQAQQGRVDLNDLIAQLFELEIRHVLLEGGAHLVGAALEAGLVDKMHIYVAPKICGDVDALNSVVGLKPVGFEQAVTLENMSVEMMDPDIFIQGYVHRNY